MKPCKRRHYVTKMNEQGVSERRSCDLAGLWRSTYRYKPVAKDDSKLADKLHQIAKRYNKAGYRTAWAYLRREGIPVNHKRVYRVWREEGLSLPRRRKRTRKWNGSVPLQATHLNHVWTYDFVHDRTEIGQPLRILTIEDEYTREGLAVEVNRSLPASRVIEVLKHLFDTYGVPEYIRSDNGPEFIANSLIDWLKKQNVNTYHIKPSSPWQNAYGESFNATLRRECLNQELFHTLITAQIKTEVWRRWYNEERPHSSLGYRTPVEYKKGIRIPLLEHGRPSTYQGGKKETKINKKEQTLYLSVVQT